MPADVANPPNPDATKTGKNTSCDGPAFGRNNSIDPMTLGMPRPRQLRGGRKGGATSPMNDSSGGGGGGGGGPDDSYSTKFSHESVKFNVHNFVQHHNQTTTSPKASATSSSSATTPKQRRLETQYKLGPLLGEGGFGQVYSVTHIETGEERAVKVMEKSKSKPKINEDIIREYNILKDLDHPNILKVYEMYETKSHFFIVTDLYSGGDLFSDLEEYGCFEEKDCAQLMNIILTCMNYCHKRHLCHLDLKPENVLLTGRGKDYSDVKIIDFGLSKYQPDPTQKLKNLEGSSYYMAPQVIKKSYIGSKADVWSCGIICHVMMTGAAPFDGPEYQDILNAIVQGEFDFDGEEWEGTSDEIKDFIKFCLTYDEDKRPTAKDALMHPFIKKSRRGGKRSSLLRKRNSARNSLKNLDKFACTHSKLKQATCVIMAAQLLSQQEKDEIDDVFRNLDLGCDGLLDEDELKRAYHEYFNVNISDKEVKRIFKEVNISGSGAISYSEFAIAVLMSQQMVDEDKLHSAFNLFDEDNKGHISSDDVKRVLMLGDEHDEYLKKKILRQVDAEDTGKIEYEDFKKIMLSSSPTEKKKKAPVHNLGASAVGISRTQRRTSTLSSSGDLRVDLNELLGASLIDSSDSNNTNFSSVTHFSTKSVPGGGGQQPEQYTAGLERIDDHDPSSTSTYDDFRVNGDDDDGDQSSFSSYEAELKG